MKIRNMELKDYQEVDFFMQKLHKLHVEGAPDSFVSLEHPYSKEEFRKKVEDNRCISILAEENMRIIGICFVSLREKSNMVKKCIAYMDDLYVSIEARKQGIATALFKEAEKLAKISGAERMDLMVWSFNESASEFYKSMGMKVQRMILEKEFE